MVSILQVMITALEAVGKACGKRKRKSAGEIARERIQRRRSRMIWFFIILATAGFLIFLVVF
jgi:hypothetical protein